MSGSEAVPDSPLGRWYAGIREIPISRFGIADLARSCRQRLFLSHVVPEALKRLQVDPNVGELYEGELASCVMKAIDADRSIGESVIREAVLVIKVVASVVSDEEIRAEAADFINKHA